MSTHETALGEGFSTVGGHIDSRKLTIGDIEALIWWARGRFTAKQKEEAARATALAKLTDEERKALGL